MGSQLMTEAKLLKNSIELVCEILCTARLHFLANKVAQLAPKEEPPLVPQFDPSLTT